NMNYSEKFIREETLIFFIRKKDDITTPFVTMEYSLDKKQILQCYGKSDTRPAVEVLDFVNKKWLPYANEQLKLVA
ncbi:MAG: PcfJ domain-containing protein, partial [Clostridia bacterium]|nr:PcfJ domain-containing protein [Clostridia bacterium]